MILNIFHILAITSVTGGVRINGSSISVLASGSVTRPNLTDVSKTWSELGSGITSPVDKASPVGEFDPSTAFARQRRNALTPKGRSISFLNVSHEHLRIDEGRLLEEEGEFFLLRPSMEKCKLNIAKQLASGSFGSVYPCDVVKSDKVYVVKFIEGGKGALQAAEKEFNMQRRVISQYVAEAIDIFTLTGLNTTEWHTRHAYSQKIVYEKFGLGTVVIVMETMEEDLSTLISTSAFQGNVEATQKVWVKVALALIRVHEKGLVYRGLKPENVLISGSLPDPLVKLSDFGLTEEIENIAREGFEVDGTPEYMLSPEQLSPLREYGRKHIEYGASVDAWQLGILLLEMYNGWPPFYDKNRRKMLRNIKNHSPSKMGKILGSLSQQHAQMADLVTQLLDTQPTKRPCLSELDKSGHFPKCRSMLADHIWVKSMMDTLKAQDDAFIENGAPERKRNEACRGQAKEVKAWLQAHQFTHVSHERIGGQHGVMFQWNKLKCPLHTAIKEKDPLIVETLLDCGANLKCKDDKQRTPLQLAQFYKGQKGNEEDRHSLEQIIGMLTDRATSG